MQDLFRGNFNYVMQKQNCAVTRVFILYRKICVQRSRSKRPKIGIQDQLSLNAGQKYWKILQGEHSAILSTFIKLPIVIKIFVLSFLSGRFTQVLL